MEYTHSLKLKTVTAWRYLRTFIHYWRRADPYKLSWSGACFNFIRSLIDQL